MPDRAYDLDDLDLSILLHLQEDSRRPYREIAEDLGVSLGTVSNRVARLIENETLLRVGDVNPFHVGFNASALIYVSVDPPHFLEAAEMISEFPEVRWLAMLTGEADLALDVTCRDMDHLYEFITQRLQRVFGIRDIRTSIYMRIFKNTKPDLRLILDKRPDNDSA